VLANKFVENSALVLGTFSRLAKGSLVIGISRNLTSRAPTNFPGRLDFHLSVLQIRARHMIRNQLIISVAAIPTAAQDADRDDRARHHGRLSVCRVPVAIELRPLAQALTMHCQVGAGSDSIARWTLTPRPTAVTAYHRTSSPTACGCISGSPSANRDVEVLMAERQASP